MSPCVFVEMMQGYFAFGSVLMYLLWPLVLAEPSLVGSVILLIFCMCDFIWDSPGFKLLSFAQGCSHLAGLCGGTNSDFASQPRQVTAGLTLGKFTESQLIFGFRTLGKVWKVFGDLLKTKNCVLGSSGSVSLPIVYTCRITYFTPVPPTC